MFGSVDLLVVSSPIFLPTLSFHSRVEPTALQYPNLNSTLYWSTAVYGVEGRDFTPHSPQQGRTARHETLNAFVQRSKRARSGASTHDSKAAAKAYSTRI
eukprot:scaffold23137_cov66-Phaeocystis_antarctica.AAC.8